MTTPDTTSELRELFGGFRFGAASEKGTVRLDNQDAVFASPTAVFVADGVGGGPSGDLASRLVVTRLARNIRMATNIDELREIVAYANEALTDAILQSPDFRGMATTLSGLVLLAGEAILIHVGDSRVYRLRDDELTQLSRDDSWVQLMVDDGALSAEEASRHPMRNLILHSLSGSPVDPETVTITPVDLRAGDRWLITSDGLSDYVSGTELRDCLGADPDPGAVAQLLVELAAANDTRDNVSLVVADVASESTCGQDMLLGAAVVSDVAELAD